MSDLISRQDVLRICDKYNGHGWVWSMIRKEVEELSPVEPKTGHWIDEETPDGDTTYRCSECDEVFCLFDGTPTDYLYYFCPNCGAKMKGDTE